MFVVRERKEAAAVVAGKTQQHIFFFSEDRENKNARGGIFFISSCQYLENGDLGEGEEKSQNIRRKGGLVISKNWS